MMKKLKYAALIIACIAVAGCSNVEAEEEAASMFVQVECGWCWRVVYHKDTKVMYAVSSGIDNMGDFTLLMNPDGTPQLWEGA